MIEPLSGKIKNSFAYRSLKDRNPVILTKVVDTVYRQKDDIFDSYGEKGVEELKSVAGSLSELRYRLATDKPLLLMKGKRKDVEMWNDCLKENETRLGADFSWFKGPWLLSECYMYRMIVEAFDSGEMLKHFDPFQFQKEESFISTLSAMETAASFLQDFIQKRNDNSHQANTKDVFDIFLEMALWGNKFDLSISSGNIVQHQHSPLELAQTLHSFLLCDDSGILWDHLCISAQNGRPCRIDFVLDNAGLELFGDICFAEYLLTCNLADSIVFHVKSMPWYVSDATHKDFTWLLEMLRSSHVQVLSRFGHEWHRRRDAGQIKVQEHDFWTSAYSYNEMKRVAPDLYDELSASTLIIFKGDLNYRKLIGDLLWPHNTPLSTALRGFEPSVLVTLRTLKADVLVGVEPQKAEEAAQKHEDWMISGQYAVIQFHTPSKSMKTTVSA